VLSPLIAYLIVLVGGFGAGIATGLLLVAALPGGNLSKVFTYIARGNIALSITLSAAATVVSVATIPLVLHFLAARTMPADVDMPTDAIIVNELLLFLLAPLFGGMLLSRFVPRRRERISLVLIRAGLVVAAVMVICSIGTGRVKGWEYGWQVPLGIIAFCVLSQQLSMLSFRLLGRPNTDTVAVGIETTMRNINLALALIALLFPAARGADPVGDGVFFVALYYAGTAFFVATPLALRLRRVIRREQARRPGLNTLPNSNVDVPSSPAAVPERASP
jgi:BASS family bile acid:Na+ symporter